MWSPNPHLHLLLPFSRRSKFRVLPGIWSMGRAGGRNDTHACIHRAPCFILASRHHLSCRSLLNSSFTASDLFSPSHSCVCPSVLSVEDNSIGSVLRSRKESLLGPVCPTSLLRPSHESPRCWKLPRSWGLRSTLLLNLPTTSRAACQTHGWRATSLQLWVWHDLSRVSVGSSPLGVWLKKSRSQAHSPESNNV